MKTLLAVVLVLLALAQAPLAQEKPADDRQRIQGEWVPVSIKAARAQIAEEQAKKVKFTFTKDHMTMAPLLNIKVEQTGVFVGKRGERKVTLEFRGGSETGKYELDSRSNPRVLKLLDKQGKESPMKAIYEIDGDTMKLFIDYPNRPTSFASDGSANSSLLFVLKRESGKKE